MLKDEIKKISIEKTCQSKKKKTIKNGGWNCKKNQFKK
jgi:hypothetical protein